MPPKPRKKVTALQERELRLKQFHTQAPTLRAACPDAILARVQLKFPTDTAFPHAAQSFTLYPTAAAAFAYPCPNGGCDGIFDLSAVAQPALKQQKSSVSGTTRCEGTRPLDGQTRQHCGLSVRYSISVQLDAQDSTGTG
jgi:hypothetical protein